ncbi:MAG TPA: PDZ domain-containing protein [Steroidobacteraceae bacterium]|nr:PDZ domain-containing protein [Steroidobacteraceae bacterium]
MKRLNLWGAALGAGWAFFSLSAQAAAPAAAVDVDARDAPRGIERVHLTLPVKAGKLTLLYPKWLPGEHSPDGPIGGLSALKFTSNGHVLDWQRDAVNMNAFHLSVPSGSTSLEVTFEVTAVAGAVDLNTPRTSTDNLAIILWNQLVMYPAGTQSDDLRIAARLLVPAGWSLGTALPKASGAGESTQFAEVSLTTLIDSPVLTGRHFRTLELGGRPAVYMHLAADSEAALAMPTETLEQYRKLVKEATALFGATHYNEYHFLWTLSDLIGFEGIEHHQSSDNRSPERSLIDEDLRHSSSVGSLLAHEYVHSWNGKYRRPAGLATGNYDSPMRGELLWVYEGLTEYLGYVLSARSGLAPPDIARTQWADVAGWAQSHKGREWRPLVDTAIAAQIGYTQPLEWLSRTRGTDFYDESALLWLEADTLIRTRTNGGKSLDDFCKLFHGAPSTAPKVVPYDLDDVIKALNTVLPYDWRAFWTERVYRVLPNAPLAGLENGGWRLTFADQPAPAQRGDAVAFKSTDLQFSLGFMLKDEGAVVTDIVPGTPADNAGITPGSSLIAINGRKYSKDVLSDDLAAGRDESHPLELLLLKDDDYSTIPVHYAGKARYPALERDSSKPDILSTILAPNT